MEYGTVSGILAISYTWYNCVATTTRKKAELRSSSRAGMIQYRCAAKGRPRCARRVLVVKFPEYKHRFQTRGADGSTVPPLAHKSPQYGLCKKLSPSGRKRITSRLRGAVGAST